MSEGHISFYELLGIPEKFHHVAGACIIAVLLTSLGFYIRKKLQNVDKVILPEPRVSLVNISTSLVAGFRSLLEQIVGHGSDAYVGVITTTFIFILMSNFLGLIPGLSPPTESLNTNFAMAAFIFLAYQFLGFREHGTGYLKHFTGGLPPEGVSGGIRIFLSLVAILMLFIELIGHIIRPLSLSLRLWGNITGDHTLVGVMMNLIPLFLPIVFMALGVLVCVVQALVFSLLSTVYIKLAVSHDH